MHATLIRDCVPETKCYNALFKAELQQSSTKWDSGWSLIAGNEQYPLRETPVAVFIKTNIQTKMTKTSVMIPCRCTLRRESDNWQNCHCQLRNANTDEFPPFCFLRRKSPNDFCDVRSLSQSQFSSSSPRTTARGIRCEEHSSFILSWNLIGQRETKFITSQQEPITLVTVSWLGFADIISGGGKSLGLTQEICEIYSEAEKWAKISKVS